MARPLVVPVAGPVSVTLLHGSPLVPAEVGEWEIRLAERAQVAGVSLHEQGQPRKVGKATHDQEKVATAFVARIHCTPLGDARLRPEQGGRKRRRRTVVDYNSACRHSCACDEPREPANIFTIAAHDNLEHRWRNSLGRHVRETIARETGGRLAHRGR